MSDIIYFIECDPNIHKYTNSLRLVKIGKTQNIKSLKRRIQSLQIGNPFDLKLIGIIDDGRTENDIHKIFCSFKSRGEWFFCTDHFEKKIKSLNLKKIDGLNAKIYTHNTNIIDNYYDKKNYQTKKLDLINKKKEDDNLRLNYQNLYEDFDEKNKIRITCTHLESLISTLFKDYIVVQYKLNKKKIFYDVIKNLVNYNDYYYHLFSSKKKLQNIFISQKSLNGLYVLFQIINDSDWAYNHNLTNKLIKKKEDEFYLTYSKLWNS